MRLAAIPFLVLILLLGACNQNDNTSEDTPEPILTDNPTEELQTIIVSLATIPTSEYGWPLDPADHRHRSSETVIRNVFDGLVTRDTRSGVHLELAEKLDWLDENSLEIKIRQGVLFHDGVEMTADDVVFTFNRIITENAIEYPEPHTSPRKALIAPLESIEKTDSYTVLMHFSDPWPPYLQLLVHQQIVPEHYLDEVGTQGFIEQPIGCGPFKFVSASSDMKEIELERFDNYWGGAPDFPPEGAACVDRVIFRMISDTYTRMADRYCRGI